MEKTGKMSTNDSFKQLLEDIRSTPMVYPRMCDNDYCTVFEINKGIISPTWKVVCGQMRMFCCEKCVSKGTWSIRYDERKLKALFSKY